MSGNSTSVTFADGGGIFSLDNTFLTNSIVLGNVASLTFFDEIRNFNGPITGTGLNIVGADMAAFDASGIANVTNADPAQVFAATVGNSADMSVLAGVLADNGGPVETILILEGGLAQDAGDATLLPMDTEDLDGDMDTAEPLPLDARGETRVVGANVDLGAVELQGMAETRSLIVTTTEDTVNPFDNETSLREALNLANDMAGIDEITFATGVGETFENGGTIRLIRGELVSDEAITITGLTDGDGNPLIRITGDADGDDVLDADGNTDVAASGAGLLDDNSRVLNVTTSTGTTTLTGLIITGGRTTALAERGGGIRTDGSLDLTNSTVSGNSTGGYGATGGGIYSRDNTNLTNATVSGNSTSGGFARGGGIFSDNTNLTNSTVSGNSTGGYQADGGGIFSSGDTNLTNSTVSGNSTSGDSATGGGIRSADNTNLTNSTVSGNSTSGQYAVGGGIHSRGNTTLTNATVSGNSTSGRNADGGGIFSTGDTTLTNSTVSGNSTSVTFADGGGIFSLDNTILTNSIVLGNVASLTFFDEIRSFSGSTTGTGLNIVGADMAAFDASGIANVINADPAQVFAATVANAADPSVLAGVLADNGGPVETILILEGGLAQDAGDASLLPMDTDDLDGDMDIAEPLPVDARGETRVVGADVDLGAVELQNSPPVAQDDAVSTDEDMVLMGDVLADNGNGADNDPDGDDLMVSLISDVSNGDLILNPDGTFAYTPDENFNGSDSFTYEIDDGNGETDEATVTITINPVNDAPQFSLAGNQTVDEDAGAQTVAGFAIGSVGPANEAGQSLSYMVETDNPGLFAIAPTISADGTLTYETAADANGTAMITVTAIDDGGTNNGGVDTSPAQTFTITIDPVNDAPQFMLAGDQTVDEDAGAQTVADFAIGSVGPANEAGQSLSYMVTTDNLALFAVAPTISADGTLTYETAADANGTAMITVTAMDDGGTDNGGVDTSAAQMFTINVNAVNDAPVATDDIITLTETQQPAVFIDLRDNDTDLDATDTLTITGTTAGIPIDTIGQTVTTMGGRELGLFIGDGMNPDGTQANNTIGVNPVPMGAENFNDLGAGETDTFTFEYTVSDGNGGTDTATVTITIEGENDAPEIGADNILTIRNEDLGVTTLNLISRLQISDVDIGDVLTFSNLTGPHVLGSPMLAADGTFTLDTDAFNFLAVGEQEDLTFGFTVSDGIADVMGTFRLRITGRNDDPDAVDDSAMTDEDNSVSIDVLANDTDPDLNDMPEVSTINGVSVGHGLTLTATVTLDSGALASLNGDGTIEYDPNGQFETLAPGQTATDSFTYTIDDGNGGSDTATVTITVDGVNDDPVAGDDAVETREDLPVTFDVTWNDTDIDDGDSIRVMSVDTAGLMGTASVASDDALTYDPNGAFDFLAPGETATETFTYTIEDEFGGSDTATVTVTITGRDETILGTEFDDVIFSNRVGNSILNFFETGAGRDRVFGNGADDNIDLGDDADFANGANGDDTLLGGSGSDGLIGGRGNDLLDGGDDGDNLNGQAGADTILGGAGNDSIVGGNGGDIIDGGLDDDLIAGQNGHDTILLSKGTDTITLGGGRDTIVGDKEFGVSTVSDFDIVRDSLDFSAFGITDSLGAEQFASEENGNLVLDFPNHASNPDGIETRLILEGLSLEDLGDINFGTDGNPLVEEDPFVKLDEFLLM